MADKELTVLSDSDRNVLEDVVRRVMGSLRTTSGRPDASRIDRDDITAPEVYIAKSPEGGIAPTTCDGCLTGTGTNIVAGSAMCPVWRVLDNGHLRNVYGLFKRVYNIGFTTVPGNVFFQVERDKYGTWICNQGVVGTGAFDPCDTTSCNKPILFWTCTGNCLVEYETSADRKTVRLLQKLCGTHPDPDTADCKTCCNNLCGTGSWTDCCPQERYVLTISRFVGGYQSVCLLNPYDEWCLVRSGGCPGTFDCGGGINGWTWTGVNSIGQATVQNCFGLWTFFFPAAVGVDPVHCFTDGSLVANQCTSCQVTLTDEAGVQRYATLSSGAGCGFSCWQDNSTSDFLCSSADESAHATLISGGYGDIAACNAVCHGDFFCWLPGDGSGTTVCSALDLTGSGYTQFSGPYPDGTSCTAACKRPACWTDAAGYCSVCQIDDPSPGYPSGASFTQTGGPYGSFGECLAANCEVVYCYETLIYTDDDCTENEGSGGIFCSSICPGNDGGDELDLTVCHPLPGSGSSIRSILGGPFNNVSDCIASPCPPA